MTAAAARRTVLAAVILVPLVAVLWAAFGDPESEMLPPGRGAWVVDPRWGIDKGGAEILPSTRYRLRFELAAPPARPLEIEVTAPGRFRIALDGELLADSGDLHREWKRPLRVRLPAGLAAGRHELAARVTNPHGASPLRVAIGDGAAVGWPDGLGTGAGAWRAAAGALDWTAAAPAGGGEAKLQGEPFRWRRPSLYWTLVAAALLLAGTGLARGRGRGIPVRSRPGGDPGGFLGSAPAAATGREGSEEPGGGTAAGDPDPRPFRLRREALPLAVLALVAAAHLWNATAFPYQRSRLDWGGHSEHLRHASSTWRPALAEEGWQMYQPPLYYWVGGAVLRLSPGEGTGPAAMRRVQALGGLAGAAHAALTFLVLARFGPASPRARALAALVVGLAPWSLVQHAMLSNEGCAGLIGGVALAAGMFAVAGAGRGRRRSGPGPAMGALLGGLAGLALLAKFSGLIAAAAVGAALAVAVLAGGGLRSRRRALAALAVFGLAAAAVAGPYYLRNVQVYGKPFVGNWDPASGWAYEQEPGYRTPGFYLRFGEVFRYPPERARWSSLWDGLYATTWGEIHDNFLPRRDPRTAALQLVVFALAIVPAAAAAAGFGATLGRAAGAGSEVAEGDRRADLALAAAAVGSLAAFAVFTLEVPFHSTVKAFFLLHLAAPVALFVARGYRRMELGLGRLRPLLDVWSLVLAGILLELFVWL